MIQEGSMPDKKDPNATSTNSTDTTTVDTSTTSKDVEEINPATPRDTNDSSV
jgi:hypothetical protein